MVPGVTKTCPSCGAAFSCCGEGCWCAALPILETVNLTNDCYCPRCLKAKLDAQAQAKVSATAITPPLS